jgi:peroxiredoxin
MGVGLGAAVLLMSANAEPLKGGDTPPNFSLQGTDGKTHKLSDYKGEKAVVIAWFHDQSFKTAQHGADLAAALKELGIPERK